ncbi:hypothetical protein [Hyphococcus sp.]|uniref:hypothetical protein n=1 Tax=Hyphococcus sp. TaxID=2038636 RepID=UPI00208B8BAF|nr:MAG: hypothetical protein DHS20C04_26470 [Marinicaulis sp.]
MKTFLAIIGTLALLFIGLIVGLFFIGFQKAGPLIEEAHAYADESLPAIASEWNGEELWARAAPELRDILKNGGLEQLMSAGAFQFGALVEHDGADCTITQFNMSTNGKEFAVAQCVGKAKFEKMLAGYTLNIVKRDDEWKILGFFVTADQKIEQPVTVSYQPERFGGASPLALTWDKVSISSSANPPLGAGAGIRSGSKIDNAH